MELTLKCNVLKCRKELGDRALVTTCSHIFCLDCAQQSGMVNGGAHSERRTACLACSGDLSKPDDAVITVLSPSEDYKTSVLSGLCPNIIMECAGRALSFWAYQTTQEIVYQRYLEKNLAEKYKSLDMQLERTVNEANAEIDTMQTQMKDLRVECDNMRRKYDDLTQAYREKGRLLLEAQVRYDRVKRKAELGQMQVAANQEIDSQLGVHSMKKASPQGPSGHELYKQQASASANPGRQMSFDGSPAAIPLAQRGYAMVPNADAAWRQQNPPSMNSGIVQTPMRQRTGVAPASEFTAAPRVFTSTPQGLHGPSRLRNFSRPGNRPTSQNIGLGTGLSAIKVGRPHVLAGNTYAPGHGAQRPLMPPSAFSPRINI